MGDNYHRNWECPFFNSTAKLLIRCEGGLIRFKHRGAIRRYIARYCASLDGYHNCTVCKSLTEYYEKEGLDNDQG